MKSFCSVWDSEDIAQEAALRLLKSGRSVSDPGLVSRVQHCVRVDVIQAENALKRGSGEVMRFGGDDPVLLQVAAKSLEDRHLELTEMFEVLDKREAKAVKLRYIESCTYPEVAERLRISVQMARRIVEAAIEKMREFDVGTGNVAGGGES